MLRYVYLAVGCLALGLGALGIPLPVLPTTPFLLLAVFCFARSSKRLEHYLLNHRVFGAYITNYYHRQMTPTHKARTLALMWTGLVISMFFVPNWWLVGLLAAIGAGVTVHIARLKPRPERAPQAGQAGQLLDDAAPTSAGHAPEGDASRAGERSER
ncbi:YbaN family protein [Corynebacterium atypicum]|uniref:YbaN family protein n=1 Tax=Corynebacterium atypicum TaxID=191610 RepID=UPI000A02D227|nr:YbaN family protein [Corynebacterium atypicum]